MSRKIVSSYSAEPAYLHLADYFAKKLKVGKGAFIRLCIADFTRRFMTAKELDSKPLVRKWYLEVIERELYKTAYKDLQSEVDNEDKGIFKSRK